MLIIMAGLPGTGKSTLSYLLARHLRAAHIRIDTIESTLKNLNMKVGHAGYGIAFGLVRDNLEVGQTVIADSVNPVDETRRLWREVAEGASVPFREVEIVCSDVDEHRERVVARRAAYLATSEGKASNWQPPAWKTVVERYVDTWTTEHVVLDTAGQSVDTSFRDLCQILEVTSFHGEVRR